MKEDDELNDTQPTEPEAMPESENITGEENTIQSLKQQLERLKKQADENMDFAKRAKAEVENIRRRSERDVANAYKFSVESLIVSLLPVVDSLEHGIAAVKGEPEGEVSALLEGMQLTIKLFVETLAKNGVQTICPLNEAFNPAQHEAIAIIPSEEIEPGFIIDVVQKGYILNERVIRPARVVVSKEN